MRARGEARGDEAAKRSTSTAPRVLLVDDDRETCVLLRSFLEEDGIEVIGMALDGLVAASLVEQLKPDVVVMDQRMPGMDGIETTRRIKADFPEVEVILLTFASESDQLSGLKESGAFGHIVKGCPPSTITEEVNKAWRSIRKPGRSRPKATP